MSGVIPRLRSIYFTPISDIVRLRITNRLDWRSTIAQSGLPLDVRDTITSVVSKTRLWRSEKASVTDELISHFLDGHDSGLSYEELLQTFGDVTVASQLIRRAKERNQPMARKIAKAVGWTSLAAVISLVVLWFYFSSLKPNPNTNYLLSIMESVRSADDSDKAWPLYREAWIKHRFCGGPEQHEFQAVLHNDQGALCEVTDEKWPDVVAFVEARKDLLDAFRSGVDRPLFGLELHSKYEEYSDVDQQAIAPVWYAGHVARKKADTEIPPEEPEEEVVGGWLIATLLPHTQSLPFAAKMLRIDTRIAVQENNPALALKNLKTIMALARQISDTPFIVSQLGSDNIATHAFDEIEKILTEHPDFFSDAELVALKRLVEQYELNFVPSFENEIFAVKDVLQTIYTDDGDDDGRLTKQGLTVMSGFMGGDRTQNPISFAYSNLKSSRKKTIECFENYIELAKTELVKPLYEKTLTNEELLDQALSDTPGPNEYLIKMFGPEVVSFQRFMRLSNARQDSVTIAIAAEQFKRRNGRFPERLDQLTGEFLKSTPLDPMNGNPFGYILSEGMPIIYSVGDDKIDGGGIGLTDEFGQPRTRNNSMNMEGVTGDWIFWPTPDDVYDK